MKRQSKDLEILAAKSKCLSSTSVRPVDRSYDKQIDGINGDNGSYSDGCARSRCCSLEGILCNIIFCYIVEINGFLTTFVFIINRK